MANPALARPSPGPPALVGGKPRWKRGWPAVLESPQETGLAMV